MDALIWTQECDGRWRCDFHGLTVGTVVQLDGPFWWRIETGFRIPDARMADEELDPKTCKAAVEAHFKKWMDYVGIVFKTDIPALQLREEAPEANPAPRSAQ